MTRAAVELVTRFETFQPEAAPLAGGGWSVGYGHTRSARQGVRVSRSDAEALLRYDLDAAAHTVEASLFAPVTQRQFEALTAFCFNIGAENFRRSTALARVNAGAALEAADEIERWRHAELGAGAQVVDALVRRRAAEKAHFLGLPEGFSKSPSPTLRPLANGGLIAEALEPPPVAQEPAPSATLDAANGIQARLRALIPDAEAASSPAPEPDLITPPHPTEPALSPAADPPPPEHPPLPPAPRAPRLEQPAANDATPLAELPPAPAPAQAPPPPPPPPPPVIEPQIETAFAPPHEAPSPDASPFDEAQAAPARPPSRLGPRTVSLAFVAVGACLFVAACVMILGGKPTFPLLGLGVLGAVLMAPGVYGLLGPRPASTP